MKIIQCTFNVEVNPEQQNAEVLVFPTLAKARKEAIALLHSEMADAIENIEKYGALEPDDATTLMVEISEVTLPSLNRETMCDILNSGGLCYVREERPLLRISLEPLKKRPKIEKL